MKKYFLILLAIFNFLFLLYLVKPAPQIPDLPNSLKSDLPGDTIQIPNVKGYFTNMSRTEVINFYKSVYGSFTRIIVNHPPEKSKEVFVDTMQSYYLEEFVIPFKESLYINGFEWESDVFTKPEKRVANKLIYQGKEFKSKITIRTFPVSIPKRIFIFFFTEFIIYLIYVCYRKKV